jgi:hypothetical protein
MKNVKFPNQNNIQIPRLNLKENPKLDLDPLNNANMTDVDL